MVTAIENFLSIALVAAVSFAIALCIILLVRKFTTSSSLRVIRRKPLILPSILLLIVLLTFPAERIGPPPDMMDNNVVGHFTRTLTRSFQVVDVEPYLPRVRVTYTYDIEMPEYITCYLLVMEAGNVVANVSTTIIEQDSNRPDSSYSTFNLPVGAYSFGFTQIVFDMDGSPTLNKRIVFVQIEQLQDTGWITQTILWDQYRLLMVFGAIALFFIGIWVTDHKEDNEVERERYERKKRGERNYPYWRTDRRMAKSRQLAERMRDKR